MKTSTKLRLFGAVIVLFNLWMAGNYNIGVIPLLVLTFGFAAGFEILVVRPAAKKEQG